jgi:signal transduction histidine kinase
MSARTWLRRHCVALDVLIAVGFVVVDTGATLAGGSWWPAHPSTLAWTMLALQALADMSLVFRRRAPVIVIAILAAFTLALSLLISPAGLMTPANSGTIWAPYGTALAAYGPFYYRRARWAAFADVGFLTLVVARVWDPSATVIAIGVFRTALGPLLALYFTARRETLQALRDRAERAERERFLLAEQARAEERTRLAGEMHDVVTHRVSLMVLQAGALQITAPDEATRRAADELRAAGVQALDELRDLVGILRTAPEDDQALPTAGLAALVAESTAIGTAAQLVEEGDPALASPLVARTAYRIVREALTNVHKHAPGARVVVRASYRGSEIRLHVHNTAAPGPPTAGLVETGSGLGIANLRQRVELMHGALQAGATPDGGFSVEATLPAFVPTATPDGAHAAAGTAVPAGTTGCRPR